SHARDPVSRRTCARAELHLRSAVMENSAESAAKTGRSLHDAPEENAAPAARAEQPPELKRALGPFALIMLGIGAVIGTGIFTLTGQAAAVHAGPAIVLSMLIAG